ncbi:MAG: DNA photolyase, partial [Verrucomicrobia bacterium]|nr:DNA photolyase [Verrucomicrobiota bacterium]
MSPASGFPPTRDAALVRLAAFLPAAASYAADRNFVRPGNDHVSKLSPWLQKRLLLEEEVVAAARGRWPFAAVEKFVQEVYWRTYWKGWLEQRPAAWTRWREAVPRLTGALQGDLRVTWEAAREGRTGIAGFDAWAQELVATGYMHNHARMWFASIWIFTLRLPWELGAAFFYEHLLDGDVASNTLSWRWVAGLQTAGKTYLARADNIAHYTEGRHIPESGRLATTPIALTEEPLPKVPAWTESPPTSAGLATSGPVGLWLHPEDLAVERGELAGLNLAAINASWPTGIATAAGRSPKVADWTRAALDDGAQRASAHFGAEVSTAETSDLAASLVDWARKRQLQAVVAFRPFVGPWLPEALAIESALTKAGITMRWR